MAQSKLTVSALCAGLDGRAWAFNKRRIEGDSPFVLVDILFLKSQEGDRVVPRAALVVSDSHGELKQAVAKHFQGVAWQRCQVHLIRNILWSCSARIRADVAAAKLIFLAADMTEAKRRLAEFVERFEMTAAKAVTCLEEGFADTMAVMTLPEKYRLRFSSNNMQQRLNKEIRRRERVICLFLNNESALRRSGDGWT